MTRAAQGQEAHPLVLRKVQARRHRGAVGKALVPERAAETIQSDPFTSQAGKQATGSISELELMT